MGHLHHGLVLVSALSSVGLCSEVQADTVTVVNPFLELYNVEANSVGFTSGQFIRYGAVSVTPYGTTTGTATTTNTNTGAAVSRTISAKGSPNSPNFYVGQITYNTGLNGPWTLAFQNGANTSTTTFSIPTGTQQEPFVQNLTLTGGPNPTVSWTPPTGNATVNGYTLLLNAPTQIPTGNSTLTTAQLAPSITQYTFSASSYNGYTISPGNNYFITVRADQTRDGTSNLSEGNILAESNAFTYTFQPTPVGSAAVNLPIGLVNGGYQFNMTVAAGQTYYIDPAVATGYVYQTGATDPNFASVSPTTNVGNGVYQLWVMENGQFDEVDPTLAAGQTFNFLTNGFLNGVSEFEILGIDPNADLDPTDSTAFITALTFIGGGTFTGTQTPITTDVSATPIPAALPLFATGLGMLGWLGGRRKRKNNAAIAAA